MARKQLVHLALSSTKMPEIMPWLKAQKDKEMSVYMLIRMAQKIGGNRNWPDVTQDIANQVIFGTNKNANLNSNDSDQYTAQATKPTTASSNKKPEKVATKKNKATKKPKDKASNKDLDSLGIKNKSW